MKINPHTPTCLVDLCGMRCVKNDALVITDETDATGNILGYNADVHECEVCKGRAVTLARKPMSMTEADIEAIRRFIGDEWVYDVRK